MGRAGGGQAEGSERERKRSRGTRRGCAALRMIWLCVERACCTRGAGYLYEVDHDALPSCELHFRVRKRCILSAMAKNATRQIALSAVGVPTPKFLSLAVAGILAHRRRRRDRSSFVAQRCKNRAPHPNELLPRKTWFWLNHPRGLIDQSCQRIADFGRLGFFPLSRSSSMRTKSCAKDTWQIAERRARDDLRATMRAREARSCLLLH